MKDYHINIAWSDEDGRYFAELPDLPNCSAFGHKPEEALAELGKAKEAWLATAMKLNKPIPPPRYRPIIYQAAI